LSGHVGGSFYTGGRIEEVESRKLKVEGRRKRSKEKRQGTGAEGTEKE
jgi:hypothetical protein